MSDSVTIEIANSVATVMLNRPDKHNAVDLQMFEALTEAGNSLKENAAVRAVVLHGSGSNFCAGIDVSVFAGEGIGAVGDNLMDPGEQTPANVGLVNPCREFDRTGLSQQCFVYPREYCSD